MKCPSCKHEFGLTVGQYLREPLGRHNCPACKKRFKLEWSFSYLIILLLAGMILAGIPTLLVMFSTRNWYLGALTCAICGALFIMPIDIWLDDKWRKSVEL